MVDDSVLEDFEGGGRVGGRRDNDAVVLKQSSDLQEGAVHGGSAAVEQDGEGFGGEVDS